MGDIRPFSRLRKDGRKTKTSSANSSLLNPRAAAAPQQRQRSQCKEPTPIFHNRDEQPRAPTAHQLYSLCLIPRAAMSECVAFRKHVNPNGRAVALLGRLQKLVSRGAKRTRAAVGAVRTEDERAVAGVALLRVLRGAWVTRAGKDRPKGLKTRHRRFTAWGNARGSCMASCIANSGNARREQSRQPPPRVWMTRRARQPHPLLNALVVLRIPVRPTT
jgi:hypothetical protein